MPEMPRCVRTCCRSQRLAAHGPPLPVPAPAGSRNRDEHPDHVPASSIGLAACAGGTTARAETSRARTTPAATVTPTATRTATPTATRTKTPTPIPTRRHSVRMPTCPCTSPGGARTSASSTGRGGLRHRRGDGSTILPNGQDGWIYRETFSTTGLSYDLNMTVGCDTESSEEGMFLYAYEGTVNLRAGRIPLSMSTSRVEPQPSFLPPGAGRSVGSWNYNNAVSTSMDVARRRPRASTSRAPSRSPGSVPCSGDRGDGAGLQAAQPVHDLR